MPSLADILAAAKVTIEKIQETASVALKYLDIWDAAGGNNNSIGRFFKFVHSWMKKTPGSTFQDATTEYYTASYWANQGKYIGELDPDVQIPRFMARTITRTAVDGNAKENYRYQVSATFTWFHTGYQGTFNTYVYSSFPLTQSGAMAQAIDQFKEMFESKSKPSDDEDESTYWWVTAKVNEFVAINTVKSS